MSVFLSLLFLVALAGVIAWIKSRGYFQHLDCTCKKPAPEKPEESSGQ